MQNGTSNGARPDPALALLGLARAAHACNCSLQGLGDDLEADVAASGDAPADPGTVFGQDTWTPQIDSSSTADESSWTSFGKDFLSAAQGEAISLFHDFSQAGIARGVQAIAGQPAVPTAVRPVARPPLASAFSLGKIPSWVWWVGGGLLAVVVVSKVMRSRRVAA